MVEELNSKCNNKSLKTSESIFEEPFGINFTLNKDIKAISQHPIISPCFSVLHA